MRFFGSGAKDPIAPRQRLSRRSVHSCLARRLRHAGHSTGSFDSAPQAALHAGRPSRYMKLTSQIYAYPMRLNRATLLRIVSALSFAMLTWGSFRASLLTGQPWDWQFPGVRESAQGLPDWFVRGQQSLLWRYGTTFTVAAAISGAVATGFLTRSNGTFSRLGRIAFSCSALALPLVGWFGPFSIMLFGVAALPSLLVVVQAARSRTVSADLACIPFNLLLLCFISLYCGDWFSVYGD